ncbi:MAG TPA: hypothetical protein DEA26_09395 [Oceanospirillales bacterium]|nr:hypothetical protein [Oceanospirillales bacterium]|tara:strand:+ start:1271 stop:2902 length:1632 start_codon:yes stop_codon:yes gene_type:complete
MNSDLQLKNKRVLVVDDLVEARSAMKSMMAMLGAENVETARDGREATDMIMEKDYDLVLSDYNLGKGKDGQQVLEEARHTNRLKATSVFIIVTGENAVDKVMGALEHEPDGYLTKPYTLSILRERLTRLMVIKDTLKPINQAIDLGDIDWAISMAHNIIQENPAYLLPASRILGKLHLQRQEYSEALEAYNTVLEQRPAIWARLGQAVCVYHLGDPDKAATLLREILIDHPLYVQCHDWLARIMLEKEKKKEAQQELQAAVAISPRGVLRQIELGRLAVENDDHQVAQTAFEQAMRLGRHSCYKSSENYMNFIKALQHNLGNSDGKDNKILCSKAMRALDEVKQEYAGHNSVIFDANIAESHTYHMVKDKQRSRTSADKAEEMLTRIKDPTCEQQIQMTEIYVDTEQMDKAKDMLAVIREREVPSDLLNRLDLIKQQVEGTNSSYSAELNTRGVGFYEKGKYAEAIAAFDEATKYDQAGASVLLNSIQAKVSYIETQQMDLKQLKDCYRLFRRIGTIGQEDERYGRYEKLRDSCERLRRSAGI